MNENDPGAEIDLLNLGTAPSDDAPAADPGPKSPIDTLTTEERDNWRLTGDLPERTLGASKKPTDSTPSTPVDPAASTEASTEPASEPGKSAKPNAETRKQQLNAEIQSLLQQRAQLRAELEQQQNGSRAARAPDVPAASSPAAPPAASSYPSFEDYLAQPGHETRTYEDYTRALVDHAFFERAQQAADYSVKAERLSGFKAQLDQAVSADPSFWHGVSQELQDLVPVDQLPPGVAPNLGNVAAQLIAESSVAPQVLRYLSEHGEVLAALKAERTPEGLARALGRLEGQLAGSAPATSPALTAPVVSRAPAPAPTLGTRPALPADDVDSAVARSDFAAYRDAKNRREIGA